MSLSETMSSGVRRKKISVKDVRVNSLNFYEKEIVDSLASSIEVQGQLSSAIVYAEDGEDGKKYTLVDGETRYLAICKLYEEGKHDGSFDVVIRLKPENDMATEDMLMDANLQRTKTKEERLKEIEKAIELYAVYKEKNLIPVGMKKRDWIGKKIGLTGRQVQNYLSDEIQVDETANNSDEVSTPTVRAVLKKDIDKAIKRAYKTIQKASDMFSEVEESEVGVLDVYEHKVNDVLESLSLLVEYIQE